MDWMKTLGMYLIIAGHFFPVGYEYIYTFSVPLFFMMSGFLSKKEVDTRIFFIKIFQDLIIPCVIICLIVHFIDICKTVYRGNFIASSVFIHVFNCIMGEQGEGVFGGGLDTCWFIYTLILCRIINQFTIGNRFIPVFILAICFSSAIFYNDKALNFHNAIINTSLAYPFFLIGRGMNPLYYKLIRGWNNMRALLILTICAIIVEKVSELNGAPWMYSNHYGVNIFLFFLGGFTGTFGIFVLCYFLRNLHLNIVNIISRGNIIILGFHLLIVKMSVKIIHHLPETICDIILYNYYPAFSYLSSLLILILFIPIIYFGERYIPALLGSRVKGSVSDNSTVS